MCIVSVHISLCSGCLTHGRYLPSLLANITLLGAILGTVAAIFMYKSARTRQNRDQGSQDHHKALEEMYAKIDPDGDGIGPDELQRLVEKIDPLTSTVAVEQMFREADADGSG